MEIKLKGRAIPRNAQGDAEFRILVNEGWDKLMNEPTDPTSEADSPPDAVLYVFTAAEVIELVNRALYQLEYQLAAHRKYGARKRAEEKALRDALKRQGVDVKKTAIDKQLKGE